MFFSVKDPTTLILNGISIGLAAAAALELAYTLFTPGPDEALDPLMLALSATLLLKLTQLTSPVSMGEAVALLLLGLLLARKPPLPGIREFWCSIVPVYAP